MPISELIDRFSDVPLDVSVAIAIGPLRVSEIVSLRAGEVLRTDAPATARVTVFAGDSPVAQGESSQAGVRLTVRLIEIGGGE